MRKVCAPIQMLSIHEMQGFCSARERALQQAGILVDRLLKRKR
jgi:hypothetical protein